MQFSNALFSILVIVPFAVTVVSAVHPLNILEGITLMDVGSSMLSRDVQPEKWLTPLLLLNVTPSGRLISVSAAASENVALPDMYLRVLGSTMVVSAEQLSTILPEDISSTPSSKVIFVSCFIYCIKPAKFLTEPGIVSSVIFEKYLKLPPIVVSVSGSVRLVTLLLVLPLKETL